MSKLGSEYLTAYLLTKSARYANYQTELLTQTNFNQEKYLKTIAWELEPIENQIKALQAKSTIEPTNQQLLTMLGQRIKTGEIKNNGSFLYEEDPSGKGKMLFELATGKVEPNKEESK